jgi:hypothetical protein
MRSHSPPPPVLHRRTWCLPSRSPAPPPPPLFASQRDLVVLSLLLRPERDPA